MHKSLLWKNEKTSHVVPGENYSMLSDDLKLNKLMSVMSKEPNFIMRKELFLNMVTDDESNILYRQCILRDFLKRPEIKAELENLIILLDKMKKIHKILSPDLKVPELMLRLKKLELFAGITGQLEILFTELEGVEFSDEYLGIGGEIKNMNKENGLKSLTSDILKIKAVIRKIQSVDIGINIDHQFDAREAIITSLNEFKYPKSNIIDKINCPDEEEFDKLSVAQEIDIKSAGYILSFQNVFYNEIEPLLNRELHKIESLITKYEKIITSSILSYRDEISLYYGAVRLYEYIRRNNWTCCYPSPVKLKTDYKGLYSLAMAYDSLASSELNRYKVVMNDINLADNEKALLITGANDGGKTVLLETIGVTQLLFQNGLPVPAEKAEMKVFKNVFTHFQKDEDISVGAGRLGEEAGRISRILQSSGDATLVLFNEPYVTTSPLEGLDILVMTINKFLEKGSTICLVTHYLSIISKIKDTNRIASYVLEFKDGERAYKALRRTPMTKSHAMEVAKEHGVDSNSIIKLLKDRAAQISGEV